MVDDGSGGAAGVGGAMHRRTDYIIATASSSLEEFIEVEGAAGRQFQFSVVAMVHGHACMSMSMPCIMHLHGRLHFAFALGYIGQTILIY